MTPAGAAGPRVGVIMGSDSDWPVMADAGDGGNGGDGRGGGAGGVGGNGGTGGAGGLFGQSVTAATAATGGAAGPVASAETAGPAVRADCSDSREVPGRAPRSVQPEWCRPWNPAVGIIGAEAAGTGRYPAAHHVLYSRNGAAPGIQRWGSSGRRRRGPGQTTNTPALTT